MLEFLKIENLALLRSAQIDFKRGFTVVTGETGAGKSVLLGALSMLAGSRAGKEIINSAADTCSVEAVLNFADSSALDEFLAECGLPPCEDGALVLRRTIDRSKAGKCFINGALSTLSSLQRLGEFWIDFHGPGEPQKLFSAKNQLEMLDEFAKLGAEKQKYLDLYSQICAAQRRIAELKSAKKMSPDEIEFARAQIEKIDALNLSEQSVAELESSYTLMENAREIMEKSAAAAQALSGENGALDMLAAASRLAPGAHPESAQLLARLKAASIEVADIAAEFESLASKCSFSEGEARQIRENMDAWLGVRRKYGATVAEVLLARDNMLERLSAQGNVKEAISREEEFIEKAKISLAPIADEIFKARKSAAMSLSKKVVALLKKIGFKKPDFKIEITTADIGPNCGSACEFEFSANPGQEALPLAKIASSGELARVMLAIKAVMADADRTALLVFDEVDANVGGEIGAEVGRELSNLSGAHQVFCVTHLPQVAAFGANHLLVQKIQTSTQTSVKIAELAADGEERVLELARMLGDRNSKTAITHARGLLSSKISK
ncbi:MAG: DNA repair protein RecN [Opitutales bacterium]|nr:DNA repair protein RecN [Opitutales bacterium]